MSEPANNTIRKITSSAVVTTLAGSAGNSGSTNGTGNAARFYSPAGLTVDTNNNIYVVDTGNQTIRKITASGVVTTFAGSAGIEGSADGSSGVARFRSPHDIAIDSSGFLYVSDSGNNTIRKIILPAPPAPTPTPTLTPSSASLPVMNTGANVPSVVAQSPFSSSDTSGGNSYSFNASTNYISFPGDEAFAFGTGDFTIEWFQYQTDSSSFPRIFAIGVHPNTSIGCSIESGTFYAWAPNAANFGSVSVKNAWHHFAIVRRSNTLYVYKDGVSINTPKNNNNNFTNTSTTLYIGVENGGSNGTYFGGYITNFRWTKGLAIYTGNFTVPTSSLTWTADANPYGGSNTVAVPAGAVIILLVP